MYPSEPTQTELINQFIKDQSTVTNEWMIKHLLEQHDTKEMNEGVSYYFVKNTKVNDKKRYYWQDGQRYEDVTKPNNRLAHGWHKLLVDQKVSYLTGNPVVVNSENEEFTEKLNEFLNDDFDDTLSELVKGSSNKGVEYLHPYIDEEGQFQYMIIPAEQVILLRDKHKDKEAEVALRVYPVEVNGIETTKVEWWDKKTVTYYIEQNGEFVLDQWEEVNPASHFYFGEEGYGWEKVPFIPFKNNEEEVSDLTFYKTLVDSYDRITSESEDNHEELQDLIYILRGYEGESLSEFQENLRYYKAMKVSSEQGAGVDTLTAELPIESTDKLLDRREEDIITFGMGVNPKQDAFGSNPSGVALQFLYSLLDMKANALERKYKKSLKKFVWFIKEYLSISENTTYDDEVTFTFNKSMIFNETEQIENALKSGGTPSQETALANNPWVDDVQKELERKQKELDSMTIVDLDEGDDNEPTE